MEGEQTRITQNTRTLSGGERSYTTVALLVAMWVNMEMPFNILDEFDVFMVRDRAAGRSGETRSVC